MWSRDTDQKGIRLALLVAQATILLVCISYIWSIYLHEILPDKIANDKFLEVSCIVVNKKLSIKEGFFKKYRADFLISYEADMTRFKRWVSGNGLDLSFRSNKTQEENLLTQYREGETYTCYYDPNNPDIAILIQRYNWLSTLPLLIPSIIGLITLYYFIKTGLSWYKK